MLQKYKIFFGEQTVCISQFDIVSESYNCNEIIIDKDSDIQKFMFSLKNNIKKNICLKGENAEKIFSLLSSQFLHIFAAGGIVKDNRNRILLIFRRKRWDLPKGKIDTGEKIPEAALREVREECGINLLKISKKLDITYHIYIVGDNYYLKTTYWYEINCNDPQNIRPQIEEEITDLKWFEKDNLKSVYSNTYPNIQMLLEKYLRKK